MKRFLIALALVLLPALAVAETCTSTGACATTPCATSVAGNWTGCTPDATDTYVIADTHEMVLDADLEATGLTIAGTLFCPPQTTSGYRNLEVNASAAASDIDVDPTGALILRRGCRIQVDTSAAVDFLFFVDDGGVLDMQGFVEDTTIAAITAEAGDGPTCGGTPAERKFTITPADGVANARAGARIVFKEGPLRARHYEIVSVGATDIVICTDKADTASTQRLTPHSTPSTAPAVAHSEPEIASTSDTSFDPEVGDAFAIIDDVWVYESAGTRGYVIGGQAAGIDPIPVLYATHIQDVGDNGDDPNGAPTVGFVAKTPGTTAVFSYNNVHDSDEGSGGAVVQFTGVQNSTFEWNTIHDVQSTAEGAGAAFSIQPTASIPVDNNVIQNFHIYHHSGNGFTLGGSVSTVLLSDNITARYNLIHDGCDSAVTTRECNALEINACQNCKVHNNVIWSIYKSDTSSGQAIFGGNTTDAAYDGTVIYNNWVVNVGSGIVIRPTVAGDPGEFTSIVRNYVSHVRDAAAAGGAFYSNVFKNWDLRATGAVNGVRDPRIMKGNILMFDPAVADSATCTAGCSRYATQQTANSTTYGTDVELIDLVAFNTGDDGVGRCFYINHSGNTLNYNYTLAHAICDADGDSSEMFRLAVANVEPSPAVVVDLDDMVHMWASSASLVTCESPDLTALDTQIGNIYTAYAEVTAPRGGSGVGATCDSGSATRSLDVLFQYRDRLAGDWNFADGASGLTAGGNPAGSPIGIRAFRFDREYLDDLWDGALSYDGVFPANIANVPNTDTDGDGVIDLHDNCDVHWNPSQLDTDSDGVGAACGD